MNAWIEGLVALFLLLGSLFALVGAIGLYRLPDFFMRLHGPTKATTMGVGGMVIASLIYFGTRGGASACMSCSSPCSCSSPRRSAPTCWPRRPCSRRSA